MPLVKIMNIAKELLSMRLVNTPIGVKTNVHSYQRENVF